MSSNLNFSGRITDCRLGDGSINEQALASRCRVIRCRCHTVRAKSMPTHLLMCVHTNAWVRDWTKIIKTKAIHILNYHPRWNPRLHMRKCDGELILDQSELVYRFSLINCGSVIWSIRLKLNFSSIFTNRHGSAFFRGPWRSILIHDSLGKISSFPSQPRISCFSCYWRAKQFSFQMAFTNYNGQFKGIRFWRFVGLKLHINLPYWNTCL